MFLYSVEQSTKTSDLNRGQALPPYREILIALLKNLFPASYQFRQTSSPQQNNNTNLSELIFVCFS
jgi:hypothetical protein